MEWNLIGVVLISKAVETILNWLYIALIVILNL